MTTKKKSHSNQFKEVNKDTCTCPDCRTELDIQEYGRNLECSECGCKIDVFPDVDLYVDTGFGVIGISFPREWKEVIDERQEYATCGTAEDTGARMFYKTCGLFVHNKQGQLLGV